MYPREKQKKHAQKILNKMNKQPKISFFLNNNKTLLANKTRDSNGNATKRILESASIAESNFKSKEGLTKKAKLVDAKDNKSHGAAVPLSPDSKQNGNQDTAENNNILRRMQKCEDKTNGLVVNIGSTWFEALEKEFTKPYFEQLSSHVSKARASKTVYPPPTQVFAWTQMVPIREIKVVILGQDPYHGPGQAHGLCFSVPPDVRPPPSLLNMYKELAGSVDGFTKPDHGNLTGWAKQGVLLLNACLTVEAHKANSHKDCGWEKLTDAVIGWINNNLEGVVFLLWGAYAQKKGACINKRKHHILQSVHPSPLSAHRGFLGCKHFTKCNEYLTNNNKSTIDWASLPKHLT